MQIKPYQAQNFINNIAQNKEVFGALLYGPEAGLVEIYGRQIAKAIVADQSDPFLIANLSATKLDEDKGILADEFASMSMLGGRKLIKVEGSNKVTESLKMVFDGKKNKDFQPAGDNFVLICAGDLEKNSSLRKFTQNNPFIASIACYEDDEGTIANIVAQKFKEQGFTFDKDAIAILLGKFGKNRQIIVNEIEKLALFMGAKKHISAQILQDSIADIAQISAFGLVENFADRNLAKCQFFLDKLFTEKTSPITILRFLNAYLNKLILVQNNLAQGANLALEMKIQGVFFKQEQAFKKHLQIWPAARLNNISLKLQELEIKCKNNAFDGQILLAAFVNFALKGAK
jgi:DNA polymerase III subunit delta